MYTVNYYDVIDQEVVLPLPDTTANVDIFGLLDSVGSINRFD